MSKLTPDERHAKEADLKARMDEYCLGAKKPTEEVRDQFHKEIVEREDASPFDLIHNAKLVFEVVSRSYEIREILRWDSLDVEELWGIQEARITKKHMAIEGHITLLFKRPGENTTWLFWEGDGNARYMKYKDGKFSFIEIPGLQKNGSIFVAFGSEQHRELWDSITMFRRTSIDPDEDNDDDEEPEATPITPIDTIKKKLVIHT